LGDPGLDHEPPPRHDLQSRRLDRVPEPHPGARRLLEVVAGNGHEAVAGGDGGNGPARGLETPDERAGAGEAERMAEIALAPDLDGPVASLDPGGLQALELGLAGVRKLLDLLPDSAQRVGVVALDRY